MATLPKLQLTSDIGLVADVTGTVAKTGVKMVITPQFNAQMPATFQTIHVYAFVKGIFQDAIAHAKVTPKYTPNNNTYVLDDQGRIVRDANKEIVGTLQ